jgi:hypothetical protein
MIRTGDTIQNPVTGERITFLTTSADTSGEAVVVEVVVQPDGFVAAGHVHPSQSERFASATLVEAAPEDWSIDLEIRLYRDRAALGKAAEGFWLAAQAGVAAELRESI